MFSASPKMMLMWKNSHKGGVTTCLSLRICCQPLQTPSKLKLLCFWDQYKYGLSLLLDKYMFQIFDCVQLG